jgi:hypothetical protein
MLEFAKAKRIAERNRAKPALPQIRQTYCGKAQNAIPALTGKRHNNCEQTCLRAQKDRRHPVFLYSGGHSSFCIPADTRLFVFRSLNKYISIDKIITARFTARLLKLVWIVLFF